MLSDVLIASGPVTYVSCWIVVILIIIVYKPSAEVKTGLITYAVLPVGAVCQSGLGACLSFIGL